MSHEFDGLDATEKAAVEAALTRCRVLTAKIVNELRHKRPEHFVDKLSLADFYASLEHAADVIGQKGQRSAENTPSPVVRPITNVAEWYSGSIFSLCKRSGGSAKNDLQCQDRERTAQNRSRRSTTG
jgi:hypothetical protein